MRRDIIWICFLIFAQIRATILNGHHNCKITFRSIGDSHADIPQIEALKNIPNHVKIYFQAFSYSLHGKLMFSVGRDGLNMPSLLKDSKVIGIRPWGKERRRKLFNLKIPGVIYSSRVNAPPPSDKDILYFIFGEIDARHKLAEMSQRGWYRENIEAGIVDLVYKYIESIKDAVSQVPIKTVWIGGLFPQPKFTENTNGWSPITGSLEQRQKHVILINQRLKMHCEKEGYVFMDFSEGYSTPNGDLDMTMTDGNHHLNLWTEVTKNNFSEKFVEHFNKVCT